MTFFSFDTNKKFLKQAFYSAAVNLFVGFVILVAIAVYFIFKPFLQPLLWAVLFGSVLHPFKQKMARFLKGWIRDLQERNASVTVQFFYFPGVFIDSISERLGHFILKYMLVLLVIFIGIPAVLIYFHFFPVDIVAVLMVIFHNIAFLLNILRKSTVLVFTLLLSYIILVNFLRPQRSHAILCWISVIVWCVCVFYFAAFFGFLQVPVSLCFLVLLVAGFLIEVKKKENDEVQGSEQPSDSTIVTHLRKRLIWLTSDDKEKDVSSSTVVESTSEEVQRRDISFSGKEQTKKKPVALSTKYLKWLLYACLTVKFWMNLWLLYFLPLFLTYLVVKKLASYLGVLRFVRDKTTAVKNAFVNWFKRRKVVLCPTPIQGLWRIIVLCDRKFSSWIEGSIDTFSSITVMIILLIVMTIGFLFLAVQVYGETVQLVRVTKEIVNKTILSKPIVQQYLPQNMEAVHEKLNVVVDHAYDYGKKGINRVVYKFVGDEDEKQSALTEKQLSDIWDQLYQLWLVKYSGTSEVEETITWSTVLDGLSNLDMTPFVKYVKNNVMVVLKFLKSCWIFVKENLAIVFRLFRSILRMLFHSTRAILNIIIGLGGESSMKYGARMG
ncbi:transmembrane protein 245-like isoform X2 [Limulus polyphemus]|uniref:Transmembrane protein 245-like isoform X2 n=1 Tax=Limulus polyphemus TaxID=6850 RepID=A0ABM1TMU5_LIMPO|nr:transmembrane protein 245-like isoform X2 [Limulus polyphemus]